jgi:alpha-galactosidase/6-phospho-beta-glucosidase family protein
MREFTFVRRGINGGRAEASERRIKALAKELGAPLQVESTIDRRHAVVDASFVLTACE